MWWSNMRKQSIKERKHFKFKNITAMMTKLCFLQTLFLLLSSFLFCITKRIKKKRNLPFTKNGSRRNGYLNTSFFEHAQRFLLKFMYKTVIYIQILVVVLLQSKILYANVTCDVIQSLWTWMRMGVFHAGDNRINYSNE